MGPVIAYVETRPWTHRLVFVPEPDAEVLSLGRLEDLGGIYIDRSRGHVADAAALELLLSDRMHIAAEHTSVDEEAKQLAFVGNYEVTDLLQDDTDHSYERLASLPSLVKAPLRWDGRYAYWNFCFLSLAMSVGTVILWLPDYMVPKPAFMKRGSRRPEWY